MISAIIPTYRNPKYLDLCLKSATENRQEDKTEIIVIIDGYPEESMDIVEKYNDINVIPIDKNMGMQYALNLGVINATNPFVFICNDDNVFPVDWDTRMQGAIYESAERSWSLFKMDSIDAENIVITFNQVEPALSIFNFVTKDLGTTADTFRYQDWLAYESQLTPFPQDTFTPNGRIFPFTVSKRWYMTVGGFDTMYQSPYWCDVDFWLKLELTNQLKFQRYRGCHFYHFGSIATKNRGDAEAEMFKRSESSAAATFHYKWGFLPNLVEAAQHHNNSKLPLGIDKVQGIYFKQFTSN